MSTSMKEEKKIEHLKAEVAKLKEELSEAKKMEENCNLLFNNMNDLVFISHFDENSFPGKIIKINTKACHFLGYENEDFLNEKFGDIILSVFREKDLIAFFEQLKERKEAIVETYLYTQDDIKIPVEINSKLVEINNSTVIITTARDILQRKIGQKKLTENEEKYRKITELSGVGIVLIDPKGRIIEWNNKMQKITGLNRKTTVGQWSWIVRANLVSADLEDYKFEFKKKLIECLTQKNAKWLNQKRQHKIRNVNGKHKFIEEFIFAIPTKKEFYIAAVYNDITEITEAREKLKESEERYKSMFYNNHTIMTLINKENWNIIDANPAACKYYGYTHDKITTMNTADFNQLSNEEMQKLISATKEKEQTFFKQKHLLANGQIRDVEVHAGKMIVGNRELIFSVIYDITEKKSAIEAYEQSDSIFRSITNSSKDAIVLIDHNRRLKFWNQAARDMFKYSYQEVLDQEMNKLLASNKYVKIITDELNKFDESESSNIVGQTTELIAKDKFEKEFPIELSLAAFKKNKKWNSVCIIRDITERQEMEKTILSTMIETQERERKRFAEDLHDGLGPLLSTIKIYTNLINSKKINEETRCERIRYVKKLIDDAIASTKTIANNLTPNTLSDFGLKEALTAFCKTINNTQKLIIDYHFEELSPRIPQNIETVIYRIAKELINNTLKHAEAKKASIGIERENNFLNFVYFDDGKGFDLNKTLNKKKGSMGLTNIMSRIKSTNGKYWLKTDEGFFIKIKIKLEENH